MKKYDDFIKSKTKERPHIGISTNKKFNSKMFDFQKDIVRWALKNGQSAIFADCGLGKTLMQLEWAWHVGGNVLILAPLAVSKQTKREGAKFGYEVNICRSQDEVRPGINISNYEMLDKFDPGLFKGIVLDESSILKSFDGKTRSLVIEKFKKTPYKLACTATPAPNDFMELGNHSEFLGGMTRAEMLSMFFINDMNTTQKWRIKGHAEDSFWDWVCSWAVMIRKPSDLGYKDKGFDLPELEMIEHQIQASNASEGMLFPMPAATLQERIQARRGTVSERIDKVVDVIGNSKEPWIVWCNLNAESSGIAKKLKNAVEVNGSDKSEVKEQRLVGFPAGDFKILVSKPKIAGFGLNYQHCPNMVFLGLSDSYEAFYQAVRRCWRFGQKNTVKCHIVIADTEGAVLANIKRKEKDSEEMANKMLSRMKDINKMKIKGVEKVEKGYSNSKVKDGDWEVINGDCVEEVSKMKTESIGYSIYSPPFASLYTYSDSSRDMGNCKNTEEFMAHYKFLVEQMFRVTKPGRNTSFHCMNLPTSKVRDGFIGIRDFRGELIKIHQEAGWIYHSEVCIWKDPVIAMQRTKALGLLHKQLKKDSCMSRQGIPDYVVTMRKPGENPDRVSHTNESFKVGDWQKYASPIWTDINPSDTLQHRSAREHKDEKHICPLQLEVIKRAMRLWSNPGDLVLSPFMGIGSEGYVSIQLGRKFVGVELKKSYFKQAHGNIKNAVADAAPLFA